MAEVSILANAYELKSNELFRGDYGKSYVYRVPKYQREYVWGREQWRDLFDDITDNDEGYFVGAILCVKITPEDSAKKGYEEYEIIDGQQRLTTMSLFLAAIYKVLEKYGKENFNKMQAAAFDQIEAQLTVTNAEGNTRLRIFPQKEKYNRNDYLYIMGNGDENKNKELLKLIDLNEIVSVGKLNTKNVGNRRIALAYKFFKDELLKYAKNNSGGNESYEIAIVFKVLAKVNSATFVRIVAPSRASAHKLFEALNNRGVQLTITHLIKNQILSQLDNVDKENDEKHYNTWEKITEIFSRDGEKDISEREQEQFFRQSYNACRKFWGANFPVANHSNLYDEYEKMIDSNNGKGSLKLLNQLLECSIFYDQIQGYNSENISNELYDLYVDLRRINGSRSYTLLLYLLKNCSELEIGEEELKNIVNLLIKFFVRYSFTGNPPSNTLERIFIGFIDEIEENSYKGSAIYENLRMRLKERYLFYGGGIDTFETMLKGDVYDGSGKDDNIRFILSKLANKLLASDSKIIIDFWAESDKRSSLAWNIEHVLPQKIKGTSWEKDLSDWKKANDDSRAVDEIHKSYVHKLGNLTLTLYNSELGNKSFDDKKNNVKDKGGKSIGYRFTRLHDGLDKYICDQKIWTPDEIDARTEILVKKILEIFAW